MNFGSVCSGIEAASVAWHPLGYRAAWLAEIEAFPAAVLAHHYPEVPNLGDMTKIATEVLTGTVAAPDVLVGGTPCQAFSVAGMRAGLQDARGKLTIEFVRLADAIDHVRVARGKQPSITVWENVPGVLSDRGNAFGCFLGALAGEDCELQPSGKRWTDAGCVYGPKRAVAWRILDAQYFGLAQRRRRVFVVASAREGFDPASVLFEREGVRRDTPPRRGEGQNTAGTLASRTGAGGFPGTDEACSGYLQPVTGTLNANGKAAGSATQQDVESGMLVVHGTQDPDVRLDQAHTLGRNNGMENAVCVTGDIAHTLKAEGFDASEDGTGRGQPIISVALRGREGGATAELGDDVAGTLRACSGGGDKPHALVASAVRRLTPTECERLQGFPEVVDEVLISICKSEEEKTALAKSAALGSAVQSLEVSAPAAVHVQIDFGQQRLQLRSAGKLLWSVSIADSSAESRLPIPVADFVQLVAGMQLCLGRGTLAGKAESPASTRSFTAPSSGKGHALLSGCEISALASDAEAFTSALSQCMKYTTSHPGLNSQSAGSTLETLSSCVAVAISGFIPKQILTGDFSLLIEVRTPYTLVPYRNKEAADGPRYKALGNSMAVPVMRWIGERIAMVASAQIQEVA